MRLRDHHAWREDISLEAEADAKPLAGEGSAGGEGGDEEEPIEGGVGAEHRQIAVRRDIHTRLDVYLHNRLKGLSRSRIQKLIDLGGVRVNDRAPKASTTVKSGDLIDIILPPRAVRQILPEPIPLEILYEDQHFIVINKQAGLIVHPARSNLSGTLLNGLAYHFKEQVERAGGKFQPHGTTGFRQRSRPARQMIPRRPSRLDIPHPSCADPRLVSRWAHPRPQQCRRPGVSPRHHPPPRQKHHRRHRRRQVGGGPLGHRPPVRGPHHAQGVLGGRTRQS